MRNPGIVPAPDPVDAAIDHVVGFMILFIHRHRQHALTAIGPVDTVDQRRIQAPGAVGHRVPLIAQVLDPLGRDLVDHRRIGFDAGQRLAIVPQARILVVEAARIDRRIGIAEQRRRMAGGLHFQRPVGKTAVQRRAVDHAAVILHVKSGMHRAAARCAGRRLGEMFCKQNPFARERVEIRGFDMGMPQRRQAFATPLVGGDK